MQNPNRSPFANALLNVSCTNLIKNVFITLCDSRDVTGFLQDPMKNFKNYSLFVKICLLVSVKLAELTQTAEHV